MWAVIFAFFAYPIAKQAYHNSALTAEVKPKSAHWSIREINDEKWVPEVTYTYEAANRSFEKNEIFQGYFYKNPYAANEALKAVESAHPIVWYSPENPEISSMEKFFSVKQAVYSAIIFMLFIYFTYLLHLYLQGTEKWKQ